MEPQDFQCHLLNSSYTTLPVTGCRALCYNQNSTQQKVGCYINYNIFLKMLNGAVVFARCLIAWRHILKLQMEMKLHRLVKIKTIWTCILRNSRRGLLLRGGSLWYTSVSVQIFNCRWHSSYFSFRDHVWTTSLNQRS